MTGTAFFEETQRFPPWIYAPLVLVVAIVVVVLTTRQTTTVAADAVTVRFGFLYRSRIPFSEVRQAAAIAYRPIREYGGWGIKGTGRRRALNTRGDRGVLLTKTDGSTVLIGSQKPRELLAALAQAGVPTEDRLPAEIRDF